MESEEMEPATEPRELKVCVLSLYSYPLFNPSCLSPFGGSEVRASLIARELARHPDLDIHMVVFDHGQPRCEVRHGVTLHGWPRRFCPLRVDHPCAGATDDGPSLSPWLKARLRLKAYSPRGTVELLRRLRYPAAMLEARMRRARARLKGEALFGSIRAHMIEKNDVEIYDEIGADVYIAHGNHDLTATLAYYCRDRGKKYVMLSASDQDFIAPHEARARSTDIYGQLGFLMAYTVENADLILVQTRRQAELAKAYFGRDATVIPNPVDPERRYPRAFQAERILWVGKSDDRVKRPGLFVDLARRRPEFKYQMIMNLAIDDVHRRILQQSRALSNLEIVTYVPYEQIENHFAEAAVLVNTSVFEGFPDTFLQAAKYGVPVVSLQADPDGMLSQHGCGAACGGDFGRLVECVTLFMAEERRRQEAGEKGERYLADHHSKELLMPKYREALLGLKSGGAGC